MFAISPKEEKKTVRVKFTHEEDQRLIELVKQYGEKSWKKIASIMKTRTTRQCRERYINYLNPALLNGPWSEEEDKLLIEKVKEMGPKWAQIVKFFKARSDVNIKNRYAMLVTKGKAPALPKAPKHETNYIIPKYDIAPNAQYIPAQYYQQQQPIIYQQVPQISTPAPAEDIPKKEQIKPVVEESDESPIIEQTLSDPFANLEEDIINATGSDPENIEWSEAFGLSFL